MEPINLVEVLVEDSLNQCLKEKGIEKTLEIIESSYSQMPDTKNLFLKKFWEKFNK